MDADVLIVGAGPTGLATAITCRRFGLAPLLIERLEQPAAVSKALAVWSASLEAFAAMGIVDRFLAAGRRMDHVRFGDGRHELAAMRTGEGVDSPWPQPILLPQSRTEALLTERLGELGGAVERGVELLALAQDAAGVTATLRRADGSEQTCRARYLVGCDGGRSTVRHALDIPFDGHTEPRTFLLCDAPIAGGLDPASIYLWWHDGGTAALFPVEGDIWRLIGVRAGDGEAPPTAEEMQALLARHGPPGLALGAPTWLATFRINDRLARSFRAGRCFLAGDAAHIHSPAGGQGMNTGLQDGVNLGWKLAYALEGAPGAATLLDSYGPERRAIAHEVVTMATRMLHFGMGNAPLLRAVKDVALPLLSRVPAFRRRVQGQLSETENVYREGPLVALGGAAGRAGHAEVGTRAPDAELARGGFLLPLLCGAQHTLLLFGGAAASPELLARAGDRLRVVDLPDDAGAARRYHAEGGFWVLVRPDQVIAARGTAGDFSGLEVYGGEVLARAG